MQDDLDLMLVLVKCWAVRIVEAQDVEYLTQTDVFTTLQRVLVRFQEQSKLAVSGTVYMFARGDLIRSNNEEKKSCYSAAVKVRRVMPPHLKLVIFCCTGVQVTGNSSCQDYFWPLLAI